MKLSKIEYFWNGWCLCVSPGEVGEEVSDRDVGKYSVRGAVLPGHCTGLLSRLLRHCPSEKTRWTDRVQLFRHVLRVRSAADKSQYTSPSCPNRRIQLQDRETQVYQSQEQRNVVEQIPASHCLRELCCLWIAQAKYIVSVSQTARMRLRIWQNALTASDKEGIAWRQRWC